MSKVGRSIESFGFTVRKAYRRVISAKPSIFITALIVSALSIFFLGGGIYDILEKPLIAIPIGTSQILFFYPGTIQDQTILDSVFTMILYFFGLLGLLMMYQSTKYAYSPRQAYILMIMGAIFLIIAYASVENLIYAKLTTSVSGG